MSEPRRDPEGAETSVIERYAPQGDSQVLDIGCGDGRLTREFARAADLVVGADPLLDELHAATKALLPSRTFFTAANGEGLPFASGIFDLAYFSWSL
jgi:ubiquinone/menaquinone biosynthesis C-methylase UbiE